MKAKIADQIQKVERWIPDYLKEFLQSCKDIYAEVDYIDNFGEALGMKEYSDLWQMGNSLLDEYNAIIKEYGDGKQSKQMETDLKSYFQNVFYEKSGEKIRLNWDDHTFIEKLYSHYVSLKSCLLSFLEPRIIIPLSQTYTVLMGQSAFLEMFARRTCYRAYSKFSSQEDEKHLNKIFGSSEEDDDKEEENDKEDKKKK